MKIWTNHICASAVLVFLLSCASRKSEPIQQQEFVIVNDDVKKGRDYFMHHCQKCHPEGQAGLGPSINAMPAPMFLKKFQVRHGLGVMPGFSKEEISKQELDDIASYMKALRKF